jgi:hypothetical protein
MMNTKNHNTCGYFKMKGTLRFLSALTSRIRFYSRDCFVEKDELSAHFPIRNTHRISIEPAEEKLKAVLEHYPLGSKIDQALGMLKEALLENSTVGRKMHRAFRMAKATARRWWNSATTVMQYFVSEPTKMEDAANPKWRAFRSHLMFNGQHYLFQMHTKETRCNRKKIF